MADNDQSKIRYDDFVSKVQADPANPQGTIMLAGYAGAGPEGHVRIYPDPTLGNWYDVPYADVVHSLPIPDSKLGGSYVWIRSSAAIKPGSAAAAAPQGQAPMAAPQQQLQPTPTAVTLCPGCGQTPATLCQPTPQTHCFICPPLTQECTVATICTQQPQCPPQQSLHCWTSPVVCDTPPHTPATICTQVGCQTPLAACIHPTTLTQPVGVCPPQSLHCPSAPIVCDTIARTAATACTQVGCHTPPAVCIHPTTFTQPVGFCPPTQPVACGILPPTFGGCTQAGCGQGLPQQGTPQIQPQALAGPAPAAFSQHICPTPSAVHQCGQPQFSQHICPTPSAVHQCGQPQFTQHICPTPSAVNQCGQPQSVAAICTQAFACGHQSIQVTQCICPTTTVITQFNCPTFNVACVQTGNFGCNTGVQSAACFTTPVQNGVFTPFGR